MLSRWRAHAKPGRCGQSLENMKEGRNREECVEQRYRVALDYRVKRVLGLNPILPLSTHVRWGTLYSVSLSLLNEDWA